LSSYCSLNRKKKQSNEKQNGTVIDSAITFHHTAAVPAADGRDYYNGFPYYTVNGDNRPGDDYEQPSTPSDGRSHYDVPRADNNDGDYYNVNATDHDNYEQVYVLPDRREPYDIPHDNSRDYYNVNVADHASDYEQLSEMANDKHTYDRLNKTPGL